MIKFKDITNQKFNFLTAIERMGVSSDRCVQWKCICDCGKECIVKSASLRSGNTKSCGCFYRKDLTGQVFGRLTVNSQVMRGKHGESRWLCTCECGNTPEVLGGHLTGKMTRSCGCLRVNGSEEDVLFPEKNAYSGAKERCSPANKDRYKDYAGRGIEFKFTSFEQFLEHIGPRPSRLHSLDRKENDGNYELGNVRWATKQEQARNRRCDNCTALKIRVQELERRLSDKGL